MATRTSSNSRAQQGDRQVPQEDAPVLLEQPQIANCLVAPPLPDEALISVVGRYHILSCNRTTTSTFRELFHCAPFNLAAWIPPHIDTLAQKLGSDGKAQTLEILRAHTLYPLLAIFNGLSFPPRSVRSDPEKASNTPKRLSVKRVRLCLECLREDVELYGVRYIHRSHQVPGVEVCGKHSCALLFICPHCDRSFGRPRDLSLAPWQRCTCKKYVFDGESPEQEPAPVALSYARFSAALLQSAPRTTVPPRVLVDIYRERAREVGCSWGNDHVSRVRVKTEMENLYGQPFLRREDAAYRNARLTEWLKMLNESSITEPPLSRHLLFAHFLFRDAAQFLATVTAAGETAAQTGDTPPPVKRRPPAMGSTKATKPTAKQRIAGLLRELTGHARNIPDCSVESLWTSHYGLMKRLVSLDPGTVVTLRRKLQQLQSKPTVPPKVRLMSPKDTERARAVKAAASALYASAGKPEKATINRLAKGLAWDPATLDPHAFPTTLRALEECSESNWHFYARRILWSKLTHKRAAMSLVRAKSGVEYHRAAVLMHFFQDVDVSVPYDPKTIAQLLAERGIHRDWPGPCPGREFPLAGRRYYAKN